MSWSGSTDAMKFHLSRFPYCEAKRSIRAMEVALGAIKYRCSHGQPHKYVTPAGFKKMGFAFLQSFHPCGVELKILTIQKG